MQAFLFNTNVFCFFLFFFIFFKQNLREIKMINLNEWFKQIYHLHSPTISFTLFEWFHKMASLKCIIRQSFLLYLFAFIFYWLKISCLQIILVHQFLKRHLHYESLLSVCAKLNYTLMENKIATLWKMGPSIDLSAICHMIEQYT